MKTENLKDTPTLSAIVQSFGDAITGKSFDGTITSWNDAAQKIFGYTAKEAIGKNISIIIPEDIIDGESEVIERIKSDKKIDHYEITRKTKEGEEIVIALTISPI